MAGPTPASDWAERLDRHARSAAPPVRQNGSPRAGQHPPARGQDIVFGAGPAGLPEVLDRELHALSLLATAECDARSTGSSTTASAQVFGGTAEPDVRRRIAGR